MWEKFAFPAIIVAAVATIWYVFRQSAAAPAPAPAAAGYGAMPVLQLPQAVVNVQGAILPATRWNPPSDLYRPIPSGLLYPAGLTAADVAGVGGQIPGATDGRGGGCCCGG